MHTTCQEQTRDASLIADQQSIEWACFKPFESHFLGIATFDASDTDQIRRYIDWGSFFRKWEFPVSFPDVLDDDRWGQIGRSLYTDAKGRLDELVTNELRAEVIFGVWRASARGNQVIVKTADSTSVGLLFPRVPISDVRSYCVADFIKPETALGVGESDFLGGYGVRLWKKGVESVGQLTNSTHDYRFQLTADLCDLYCSALVDYLHYRLRRFVWAYCDDDDLSNEEVLTGTHQGIRVDIGGPECPDQAMMSALLKLLGVGSWGKLADNGSRIDPPLQMCSGFFLANPQSRNLRTLFLEREQLSAL